MQAENIQSPPLYGTRLRLSLSLWLPLYLALKEIWRNKGRYLLISGVVALLTTLILFLAGLGGGLGLGGREYIEKLEADIILYQAEVDLSIPASRLAWSKLRQVRRVPGVEAIGSIAFSSASLVVEGRADRLSVSLIGVEPGQPGEPRPLQGRNLGGDRANEVIIDQGVALRTGYEVGDSLTVKSAVGAEEKFYALTIVGISDSQQYSLEPSIFLPYQTWEEVRPRAETVDPTDEFVFNLIAVKSDGRAGFETMVERLESSVTEIEAVDKKTAYEKTPGYTSIQSTLNTQRTFALLIGLLVLGGFFHIQALQKIGQVGMLKAIGASNWTVIWTAAVQIVLINLFGVALGGLGIGGLALILPPTTPLIFEQETVVSAISLMLLIGPLGGIVSIRTLLRAEPLIALGLSE